MLAVEFVLPFWENSCAPSSRGCEISGIFEIGIENQIKFYMPNWWWNESLLRRISLILEHLFGRFCLDKRKSGVTKIMHFHHRRKSVEIIESNFRCHNQLCWRVQKRCTKPNQGRLRSLIGSLFVLSHSYTHTKNISLDFFEHGAKSLDNIPQ